MKTAYIYNFCSELNREKEKFICVLVEVSDADWLKLRKLQEAYFDNFEDSITFFPIGKTEVWIHSVTELNISELNLRETFIEGFTAGIA